MLRHAGSELGRARPEARIAVTRQVAARTRRECALRGRVWRRVVTETPSHAKIAAPSPRAEPRLADCGIRLADAQSSVAAANEEHSNSEAHVARFG